MKPVLRLGQISSVLSFLLHGLCGIMWASTGGSAKSSVDVVDVVT